MRAARRQAIAFLVIGGLIAASIVRSLAQTAGAPCGGGTRPARIYVPETDGARSPYDLRPGVRFVVVPSVRGLLSDVAYPTAAGQVRVDSTDIPPEVSPGQGFTVSRSGNIVWRAMRSPRGMLVLEIYDTAAALPSTITAVPVGCPSGSPATTFTIALQGGSSSTTTSTTSTTSTTKGSTTSTTKGSTSNTTTTTTTSTTLAVGGASLDWSIDPKLKGDDGVLTNTDAFRIPPTTITLTSTACTSRSTVDWTIDGRTAGTTTGCQHRGELGEGTYAVAAQVRGSTVRATGTITIENFVVASLGDSNGSGEGNPNPGTTDEQRWTNPDCHRSQHAGSAVAAQRLEDSDRRSVVTLIHLACSGGRIDRGLLGSYNGMRNDGRTEPPQLQQLNTILRNPDPTKASLTLDAVVVSVGINMMGDDGFSEIILSCILFPRCDTPSILLGESASEMFERNRTALDEQYFELSRCLRSNPTGCDATRAVPVASNRVFVTEYPDSSTDENGQFCALDAEDLTPDLIDGFLAAFPGLWQSAVAAGAVLGLSSEEFAWFRQAGRTLNSDLRRLAGRAGYSYVGRIADQFVDHGYCATRNRYLVQLAESKARQGNTDGSFHANAAGHAITAGAVFNAMYPLLPNPAR